MQVSLKKHLQSNTVKQFLSYFCVGGVSAIVEWVLFVLLANLLKIDYLVATCLAFVFSTTTNWFLGRRWTFKSNNKYTGKEIIEIELIFLVSGIGLLFNLGLMYLFVSVLRMDTPVLKAISKIISTGIVFIWNFLIRKLVIYRNQSQTAKGDLGE